MGPIGKIGLQGRRTSRTRSPAAGADAEDDEDDRRGPVDKMKGWQPPSNMVRGTDTTDWTQWDRDDMAGDEFIVDDSGDLDESDGAEGDEE